MARQRKPQKFDNYLSNLSVEDLKQLREETVTQIRRIERETAKAKVMENAKKLRDKIRIGNKVTFNQRGAGGGRVKAEVIGIFADKVQVEVNGRKRSVALVRIEAVE